MWSTAVFMYCTVQGLTCFCILQVIFHFISFCNLQVSFSLDSYTVGTQNKLCYVPARIIKKLCVCFLVDALVASWRQGTH